MVVFKDLSKADGRYLAIVTKASLLLSIKLWWGFSLVLVPMSALITVQSNGVMKYQIIERALQQVGCILRSMIPDTNTLEALQGSIGKLQLTGELYEEANEEIPPEGELPELDKWPSEEEAIFHELNVKEFIIAETYLAAFLACWPSVFVFPQTSLNMIRLVTFKVASMLAQGQNFYLAIPVLAQIYRGLRTVA
ncbi:hypothetical protein CRG98_026438 [Punica granatum]|uniref:Aminotransferase-like plant mobile domain-containing protein n=1 Tax=Punica granatum TaxID=22663 RepID=A0A2I0JAA3_PUNGR|nr:hypothetical protein CRG98_026438 [Punica granatum]